LHTTVYGFNQRKKISPNIQILYQGVEMILKKDVSKRQKFRISIDEFMMLWQSSYNLT
jgi:hypothetical protein